jgi:enamine deaminase RidA (YjgF/YER057c/UK114 family)
MTDDALPSAEETTDRPTVVVAGPGSYSQAIRVGHWLLMAGQVAWNGAGEIVGAGDLEAQIRQVFANIAALCAAAGGDLGDVVQLRTYLTDIRQIGVLSAIRQELFSAPLPTSTTVEVSALVQPELLVEIEATAFLQ